MFVLYSIAWDILGSILIFVGLLEGPPFSILYGANPYQYAVGVILMVSGIVLMIVGNTASFFKISSEIMVEAINEHHLPKESEKSILTV